MTADSNLITASNSINAQPTLQQSNLQQSTPKLPIQQKDTLFLTRPRSPFAFDDKVAACFNDMINRSVPAYGELMRLLPLLVEAQLPNNASHNGGDGSTRRIYDLGTSIGAVSFALSWHISAPLHLIAVDKSAAMTAHACENLTGAAARGHRVDVVCADIAKMDFLPCQAIVINLTLQFLPIDTRLALLKKCHSALNAGGVLILTEKIHLESAPLNAWQTARYYDFKRQNGYSQTEIDGKRAALDGVLTTDSEHTHRERLAAAGFGQVEMWWRALNFVSFAAFK